MKILSPSDLLVILTSNKELFSSKVSYQLVMDHARRAFPKHAYTVIDRMLMAVENETLQPSTICLLRLMAQQACELYLKRNHGVLNYASLNFGYAY
jgi:negative regulator of sigma E activity